MLKDLTYQIARLDAKPDDFLVLKIDAFINHELHQRIRDQFASHGITNKILILERGMDLSLLSREQIDRMTGSAA